MYKPGDQVNDHEILLRRVYKKDKRYRNPKTGIPSSRAFAPRPKDNGKLSVDIESLTTHLDSIVDINKYVLYSLYCSILKNLDLRCIYDPIENQNSAHAVIVGFDEDDESIPGILARKAKLVKVTEQ